MRPIVSKVKWPMLPSLFSVLLLASALLILGRADSAWAQDRDSALAVTAAREDLAAVMLDVNDVLDSLADESSLNATELAAMRRELRRIYSSLDALYDNMLIAHAGGFPGTSAKCEPHQNYTRDVWPRGESFDGWSEYASTDIEFTQPGVITVAVDNVDYTAQLDIMDAYFGQANARLENQSNGDMVLAVRDEVGAREFLIKDGGTGPVYKCGPGNAKPFAEGEFYPPAHWPTEPAYDSDAWFEPYRVLVRDGEIAESPELNWFIGQYHSGVYETAALRAMGEFLREIQGEPWQGIIGELSYESFGRTRSLSISDPRSSPASFIAAISVIYDLTQDGESYRIELGT